MTALRAKSSQWPPCSALVLSDGKSATHFPAAGTSAVQVTDAHGQCATGWHVTDANARGAAGKGRIGMGAGHGHRSPAPVCNASGSRSPPQLDHFLTAAEDHR